jgi:hypothetical protein
VAWPTADAVLHLRRLIGDDLTDKFNFKIQVIPSPDGQTKVFACGDENLLSTSVKLYVDGIEKIVGGVLPTIELVTATGTVYFSTAPQIDVDIQMSYNYQWFTDIQMQTFLTAAANTVGLDGIESEGLPMGLRPAVGWFAAYYAYMNKAGEMAESLTASAEGFTVDQGKSFGNWKRMAENAWQQGREMLDFYNSDPLNTGATGPSFAMVGYRLPNYVPNS